MEFPADVCKESDDRSVLSGHKGLGLWQRGEE